MAKRKVTAKKSKTTASRTRKKSGSTYGGYAVEHDFIIITGGGLIVMILVTLFMFGVL